MNIAMTPTFTIRIRPLVLAAWFTSPQFNGKQEDTGVNAPTPRLRCPRNGQLDE
jgi:hypothetical protein